MSIYDFYPMKKRRLSLCKTPNGGRSGSTLGKLKKNSEQLTSTVDAGIEVHWDNNSPSPTTTLALAGKRRRQRKNNRGDENNEVTDISFVVQKLSENTSPVVDHTRSTLLEMWVNQEQHSDDYDKEFTSPPNQSRHEKGEAALATPLNQRRTSKRTTRKATRQFMLEIRKLVDEIQKSDINSSGNLSQRDSQKAKQQEQPRRLQSDEGCTTASEHVTIKPEPVTIKPEPVTTGSEGRTEDSFEWTEDDMDELILTCQLSSSGKGSLDVPDAPKPHFGSSPSILTHVPETQMLSWDRDTARESRVRHELPAEEPRDCHELRVEDSRDRHELSAGRSRETKPEEEKSWDLIFGEDDSFLECAALEFELSQESFPKETTLTKVKDADRFRSSKADQIPVSAVPTQSSRLTSLKSGSGRFPKDDEKTPKISAAPSRVPSVPEGGVQKKNVLRGFHGNKTSAISNDDCKKTINENHNLHSFTKTSSNCPADPRVSVTPLNDRPGNPMKKHYVKSQQNHVGQAERQQNNIGTMHGLRSGPSPNKPLAGKHPTECGRNDRMSVRNDRMSVSSDEAKESQNVIECLLSGDNFAALLEDFNFEESFNETSCQRKVAVPSTNKAPLPSTNKVPLPTTNKAPLPSTNKIPLPSTNNAPLSSTNIVPLSSTNKVPFPSTNKVPLPSTNKVPLPSTNKAPFPSTNKTPFPSTNKVPLSTTNKVPLPTTNKAPLHFANKTRQASNACKTSRENGRLSTSSSQNKKATYSKDEIERKRLEAQQRRLAKLRAASSQTRKTKMR